MWCACLGQLRRRRKVTLQAQPLANMREHPTTIISDPEGDLRGRVPELYADSPTTTVINRVVEHLRERVRHDAKGLARAA